MPIYEIMVFVLLYLLCLIGLIVIGSRSLPQCLKILQPQFLDLGKSHLNFAMFLSFFLSFSVVNPEQQLWSLSGRLHRPHKNHVVEWPNLTKMGHST